MGDPTSMFRTLSLFLALALGCRAAPCPPLDDVAVEDPAGLANEAQTHAIATAVADFRVWTTLPLCVAAITVVDEGEQTEAIGGSYNADTNVIQVVPQHTSARENATVVFHELCHAADRQYGLSEGRSEWFPPAEGTDLSGDAALREAFATVCQTAADPLTLGARLEALCGTSHVAASQAYVRAGVLLGAPQPEVVEWPVALGDPVGTPLPDPSLSVVDVVGFDGDLIVLLADRSTPVASGWRILTLRPAADGSFERVADSPVLLDDPIELSLTPSTERVLAVDALEADAWELDPTSGSATPTSLPGDELQVWVSAENQGDYFYFDEETGRVASTQTGAIGSGSAVFPPHASALGLAADADGFAAVLRADRHWVPNSIAWGDSDFGAAARPYAWGEGRPTQLPDGSILFGVHVYGGHGAAGYHGALRFDPAAGVYSVPTAVCELAWGSEAHWFTLIGGRIVGIRRMNDTLDPVWFDPQ